MGVKIRFPGATPSWSEENYTQRDASTKKTEGLVGQVSSAEIVGAARIVSFPGCSCVLLPGIDILQIPGDTPQLAR